TAIASVLDFLTGTPRGDMIEAMRAFIAVHDAAEKDTIDPKGVPIRIPNIARRPSGEPDPDDPTNTIMRGAFRMEAAMLRHGIDNEDYENEKNEFVDGVYMLNRKIKAFERERR